jgi:hypothetical protein
VTLGCVCGGLGGGGGVMSIVTARLWLKLRHQEDKGLRGVRVGSGPPEGANRPYDWAKDTTDLYKRTLLYNGHTVYVCCTQYKG